jgi:hypothetical protein
VRPRRIIAVGLALLVVAGAVAFVTLKASLGTAPSAPPSGSAFRNFQRPFGDTAPWNVPVAGLPLAPRSDEWRDRFWYHSRANKFPDDPDRDPQLADHGIMFGLDDDPDNDFSVAVYDASDATTTMKVRQREAWNGLWDLGPDQEIPWNPGWRASTGSDAILLVLDPATGRQWALWGLVQEGSDGSFNDTQCWSHKLGTGYNRATHLCAGGATLAADSTGQVLDYRTYRGNQPGARGSGIPELAMLTFPEEVAQGAIRHALMMPVYNTMGGPTCGADVTSMADPQLGTTCGRAIAPAGNLESPSAHRNRCGPLANESDATLRKMAVPEGARFALRMSDADIEAWLDGRDYSGEKRETARIFAVALRDYGWFITDTSCFAAEFQVAGSANPRTAVQWRDLGITGDGRDLLHGLMTRDRIVTIAPATNHCVDGTTSEFDCPADVTGY